MPSITRSVAIATEPTGNWSPSPVQPDYPTVPDHAPTATPVNTLAIVSLVLIFVFWPAGLACGLVARRQIRERNERGDGLALTGLIINGVLTVFVVLVFALLILFFGPGILTTRTGIAT